MWWKKLPKQEDVEEIDLGSMKAQVIEITDENRASLIDAVTRTYMSDECMYCHRNFTFEEMKEAIVAYPNEFGRIVHRECWMKNS